MYRILIAFLAALIMSTSLTGCNDGDFTATSYKTLKSCDTLYEAGMSAVASAQAKGYITEEQRENINKKAHYYVDTFRSAVSALIVYEGMKEKDTAAVADALVKCNEAVRSLIAYISENGVTISGVEAAQTPEAK